MSVPRARVEEGRRGEVEAQRAVLQEGDELVLGGRVVEPDRADVVRVGRVVVQLARVEGVPAR